MKEVDALVVGFGLAGLAYVETLRQNKTTFHVIDQSNSGSSEIAAGIYNPTVLKRFNMTWKGEEFIVFHFHFIAKLLIVYPLKLTILLPCTNYLMRRQSTINGGGGRSFQAYQILVPEINLAPIPGVKVPHGYGQLMDCGRIDTAAMLVRYKKSIRAHFTETRFDFTSLKHLTRAFNIKILKQTMSYFVKGMRWLRTHILKPSFGGF